MTHLAREAPPETPNGPTRDTLVPFLGASADEWASITTDVDHQAIIIFGLIEAIARSWQEVHSETLSGYNLNLAEWTTIGMLRTSPPSFRRSPTELRRLVGQSSAGMTRVLTKLHDDGLIRRERSHSDGRGHDVILTRGGRALAEKSFRGLHAVQRELLAPFTEARRGQLIAAVDALRLALGASEPKTRR